MTVAAVGTERDDHVRPELADDLRDLVRQGGIDISEQGRLAVRRTRQHDGVRLQMQAHEIGRLGEFRASAAILGAARAEHLGYADSGHGPVLYPDPPGRVRFARADTGEAADRLTALIREENAGLLLSYDAQGGYGHRDHVKVHEVGALAAKRTGVRVLEATVPRELAVAGSGALRALRLARFTDSEARAAGTPRSAITHRMDVRRYAAVKQAALTAHRTPAAGTGRSSRLFRMAVSLPAPVFGLLAGREWFIEPGATPGPVRYQILDPADPVR